MQDFKPPKENPLWVAFCKWGLTLEMNVRARIAMKVSGDGLTRLRQMADKRTVIVCNHSDQYDPEVTLALSKELGEDFYFIAARECFDWWRGAVGWCFQNLGCYSVVRGEADLESFRMTREILVRGKRKLVMYPEGEVTRQQDVILPLRKGAIRLFLDAQIELHKERPNEPLYVQPIGIRWTYRDDVIPRLHAAMRRVEQQLRIVPPSGHITTRIEHASAVMASILEQEYSAKARPDLPFEKRIVELREHILRSMAVSLNVELPEDETHLDWLRRVNNALDEFVNAEVKSKSAFQQRLHKQLAAKVERLRKDAIRIQHLIGITDSKEFRMLTPERLANKVAKLEREALGKVSFKGVKLAVIGVGTPIPLTDYLELFETDRDKAVEEATEKIHSEMQSIIDKLDYTLQKAFAQASRR